MGTTLLTSVPPLTGSYDQSDSRGLFTDPLTIPTLLRVPSVVDDSSDLPRRKTEATGDENEYRQFVPRILPLDLSCPTGGDPPSGSNRMNSGDD